MADDHVPPTQEALDQVTRERDEARRKATEASQQLEAARGTAAAAKTDRDAAEQARSLAEVRSGRWRLAALAVAILALLFLFGWLMCLFGSHHSDATATATASATASAIAVAQPTKDKPVKKATTAAETLGAACLRKQAEELIRTQKARIAFMLTQVALVTNIHQLTVAEAAQVNAYIIAHPNGDVPVTGEGIVTWLHVWDNVRPGQKLDPLTFQLQCKCTPVAHVKVPWVVFTHAPIITAERVGDCVVLHFHTGVPDQVQWHIHSATGPVRGSRCNVQWQGSGAHVPWYDDACGAACTPDEAITSGILGRSLNYTRDGSYWAVDGDQYISADDSILNMVVAICVHYKENGQWHSTNFLYVIPVGARAPRGEDWVRWSRHVTIPNGAWTIDEDD